MTTLFLFALLIVIYVGVIFFFRKKKLWFPYFLVGAFGLTFIIIFSLIFFGIDEKISSIEIGHVNSLSNFLGINTQIFDGTTLIVPDPTGWSMLSINVECSGILEASTIFCLIFFYPAFSAIKKSFLLTIGMVLTYVANIVRMMLIVAMTTIYGKEMVYFAHAVVGRIFFFLLVIGIYWYLITKPTLGIVYKRLEKRLEVSK